MKSESKPRQPRRWTTDKQRAAARNNGKKSKGPVTAAGKSRSANNNLRHGIYADTLNLSAEPNYTAKFRDYLNRYAACDDSSESEVEALLSAALRRRKFAALQDEHWAFALQAAQAMDESFAHAAAHQKLLATGVPLHKLESAENREFNRFQRLQRSLILKMHGSNPEMTELERLQQVEEKILKSMPSLFHNLR